MILKFTQYKIRNRVLSVLLVVVMVLMLVMCSYIQVHAELIVLSTAVLVGLSVLIGCGITFTSVQAVKDMANTSDFQNWINKFNLTEVVSLNTIALGTLGFQNIKDFLDKSAPANISFPIAVGYDVPYKEGWVIPSLRYSAKNTSVVNGNFMHYRLDDKNMQGMRFFLPETDDLAEEWYTMETYGYLTGSSTSKLQEYTTNSSDSTYYMNCVSVENINGEPYYNMTFSGNYGYQNCFYVPVALVTAHWGSVMYASYIPGASASPVTITEATTVPILHDVGYESFVTGGTVNPPIDPPIDPPINPPVSGSIETKQILEWLTGAGNTLLSDVVGTAAEIKDFLSNTANKTWESISEGVIAIPQALSLGFDGVLEGLKNLPIPIIGPLTQILDSLKDLTSTTSGTGDKALDLDPLKINLKNKFPFCIPFDFINLIKVFSVEPQNFAFDIKLDTKFWSIDHTVDLAPFRLPIIFFRYIVDFWFVWILISRTRDMIKW